MATGKGVHRSVTRVALEVADQRFEPQGFGSKAIARAVWFTVAATRVNTPV
jgi:hypothetical protein